MLTQEARLNLIDAYSDSSRVPVISLNVSVSSYEELQYWIISEASRNMPRMVCFANVHMVIEAQRNFDIAKAVNKADWVTPDGVPLAWAMQGLYNIPQVRIAGMDVTITTLKRAAEEGISVFFYGSTPQLLDRLRQRCEELFPALRIAGMISPPFRPSTPEEDNATVDQITQSGAGLVFVALGCPKQELWMSRVQGRVPAVMLGIGNALAVLVGEEGRSPSWMQKAGLEWSYRLAQDPKRLLKRYVVTNTLFIYFIIRQAIARRAKITTL